MTENFAEIFWDEILKKKKSLKSRYFVVEIDSQHEDFQSGSLDFIKVNIRLRRSSKSLGGTLCVYRDRFVECSCFDRSLSPIKKFRVEGRIEPGFSASKLIEMFQKTIDALALQESADWNGVSTRWRQILHTGPKILDI